MVKKLTITVSDEVYKALHRRIGRRKISRFIDELARTHMTDRNSAEYWLNASDAELARGYADLAADETAAGETATWDDRPGATLDDEDFHDWPGHPPR